MLQDYYGKPDTKPVKKLEEKYVYDNNEHAPMYIEVGFHYDVNVDGAITAAESAILYYEENTTRL